MGVTLGKYVLCVHINMYIYWFSAFVCGGVYTHTCSSAHIYMAKVNLSKFNSHELTPDYTTAIVDILNK